MKAREFADSLNEGKHRFTLEEIQACVRDGMCCGCGLCCIGTHLTAPPTDSPIMAVCKYLYETKEGIFRCRGFSEDHPCNAWNGNECNCNGFIAGLTDYMSMIWGYTGNLVSREALPIHIEIA